MPRNSPVFETEQAVFATRLTEIMKETNTTQATLGDVVDVKRQTISLYMNGQSEPNAKQLTAIAKHLKVSSDWLLGLSEYRSVETGQLSIKDLGLSEGAIKMLVNINNATATNKTIKRINPLINRLLELPNFFHYLRLLSSFFGAFEEYAEREICGEDQPTIEDSSGMPYDFEEIMQMRLWRAEEKMRGIVTILCSEYREGLFNGEHHKD